MIHCQITKHIDLEPMNLCDRARSSALLVSSVAGKCMRKSHNSLEFEKAQLSGLLNWAFAISLVHKIML